MDSPGKNGETDRLGAFVRMRFGPAPDEKLKILPLKGGNNRVYHVKGPDREFVLKQYFRGRRNRLKSEYAFVSFAWQNGVGMVPEPILAEPDDQIACYEFIPGPGPCAAGVTAGHVGRAVDFVASLNRAAQNAPEQARHLPDASEACFSVQAHLAAVATRMDRLCRMPCDDRVDHRAKTFVTQRLEPFWKALSGDLCETAGADREMGRELGILSPSDFGFHNAVQRENGDLVFIDFEYAGWDDPAKLVCDFFCQVAVPVPMEYFERFAKGIGRIIPGDKTFFERVALLLPLYRLKWCCILLNDFVRTDGARKKFAAYDADNRKVQLEKARQYAHRHLTRAKPV